MRQANVPFLPYSGTLFVPYNRPTVTLETCKTNFYLLDDFSKRFPIVIRSPLCEVGNRDRPYTAVTIPPEIGVEKSSLTNVQKTISTMFDVKFLKHKFNEYQEPF